MIPGCSISWTWIQETRPRSETERAMRTGSWALWEATACTGSENMGIISYPTGAPWAYPRFTVYQIIAEPIRNFRKLSKKEEEREINDLLTMMELPEEIKLRKAHELSGGQQKRVCIARALAAQPDVLIFDEAVSGLDVLVRKHILDLLKRLHQERKMTCFFITHDLDVALYLADRVMVMRCGKIIEDRTFHGSTDCFTHPYTKLLLHSIAPYLG